MVAPLLAVASISVAAAGPAAGPERVATPAVLWNTVDDADPPRLAFTDDADALYEVIIKQDEDGESYSLASQPAPYPPGLASHESGPKHEGEAGGPPGSAPAFVSTRDHPAGEIYLADDKGAAERITCNDGVETHPVLAPDGKIAYASNADGDWDIYAAAPGLRRELPPPARSFRERAVLNATAKAPASSEPDCQSAWTIAKVTNDNPVITDDLWPTWTRDGGLVFSRAAAGELSDLYSVGRDGLDWQEPQSLTTTPDVAESQPAAMSVVQDCADPDGCAEIAQQTWVAFTTTEFRPQGTIAFISPDAPDDVGSDPWDDGPQASEPTWSSTENPTHLAFTSTDDDPYGAIGIAQVAPPTPPGAGTSAPQIDSFGIVSNNVSGIGESHAFWLREFGSEEVDDAILVYTSRSHDGVAGGSRILDADISDVLAVDGGQRRVIRHQREFAGAEVTHRFDEAGPSYSPDGRRIVYSRNTNPAAETDGKRMLMVADADGSDAAPLMPDSQRQSGDLDLDPAWAPDGTKIAFVRIRSFGGEFPGPGAPKIWVYDLTTEIATRIPGTPEGADLSPSWAPDNRHLVIARTQDDGGPPYDSARRWGRYRVSSGPELHILDATDPTAPTLEFDTCRDGCAISGRTPVWSPDGSRIVYEDDGQLRLITLPDPCCTGPVIDVENPVAVTGFDHSSGEPTPSRAVISAAHDPTWSPDNSEIAFAGQPAGQPDQRGIWGIRPDGSGLRPITDERGPETEPAYQPDRAADVGVTATVANSPALIGATIDATFTVTNNGPATAAEVALDTGFTAGALLTAPAAPPGCRIDGSGCGFALLAPGESRDYQVSVRHQDAVLGTAIGTVVADNPDPVDSNDTASAPYLVQAADLQVRVKIDERIGYVGGPRVATLKVRNAGTVPVDDVLLRTTWSDLLLPDVAPPLPSATPGCLPAGDTCHLGTIAAGGKRAFRVVLEPLEEGIGEIRAEVETSTAEVSTENNEHTVELEILQPMIRVLPSVGPPGQVVLAYGENMPPASEISLVWAPGISVHTGPFEVSDDGTVRVPILIVRHDQIGTRLLSATSTKALFTPVDGVMLVVPGTLVPPNFNGRS